VTAQTREARADACGAAALHVAVTGKRGGPAWLENKRKP